MRQGNGSDVLGPNDPRSQKIGMIYVTSNDEHKNVLTAILTQEKVGRERIAVILPAQNKAFQRPADFDGLKSLRKKLHAQIVFVAPSGSPPANFARHRNFSVYSSLEGFTQSLNEESDSSTDASSRDKKAGFFGLFKRSEKKAPESDVQQDASAQPSEPPLEPISNGGRRKSQEINPVLLGDAAAVGSSFVPRQRPQPRIVDSQPPRSPENERVVDADPVPPVRPASEPGPVVFEPEFDDGDLLSPPSPEQMDEEMGLKRAGDLAPEDLETIDMPLEDDPPAPPSSNTRRNTGKTSGGKNTRGKTARSARNLNNTNTPTTRRNTGKTARSTQNDEKEEGSDKGAGLASLGAVAAAGSIAGAKAAQNARANAIEPEPIELQPVKPRRRTTVNLNQSAPEAAKEAANITRKRPSGKINKNGSEGEAEQGKDRGNAGIAVAGIAAGALAGNALAKDANTRTSTPLKRNTGKTAAVGAGTGVSTMPNKNSGGLPPRGGGRSSGGGSVPPNRRKRRGGWGWIVAAVIALLLLGSCGWTAYAQPGLMAQVQHALTGQQPATVTITPDNRLEKNSYIIYGVKENPDPNKLQISSRQLTTTLQSGGQTVQGTGKKQTPGVRASGNLTFSNGSTTSYTVGAGTAITTNGGHITVVTDVPAVIPAYNPSTNQGGQVTIRAHAADVGSSGNINSLAINKNCCAAGNFVFVKNNSAFSGGQDPQNYTYVTEQDANKVADKLKTQTAQNALNKLRGQMKDGEEMANNPQCTTKLNNTQPIGDTGENIPSTNISVTVTCTAQVYNKQQLQNLVATKLQDKANTDLGNGYKLVGKIQTRAIQQRQTGDTISWVMEAQGIWVYQISNTLEQGLAKRIAGKTINEAKTILQSTKGIGKVSIQANGDTLPSDAGQITFSIQNIQGLGDTPPGQGTPTITVPTGTPQEGKG